MTIRTIRPMDRPRPPPPDFTRLDNLQARKRVRELIACGLPESTVGDLIGWDLASVRHAVAERVQPPP